MFTIHSADATFSTRYARLKSAILAMTRFAAWDRDFARTMWITDRTGKTIASVTDRVLKPDCVLITVVADSSDYADRAWEKRFEV